MPVYGTFGNVDPVPDPSTARGRVVWQDGLLGRSIAPVVSEAYNRVEDQETTLRRAYAPLIEGAAARVLSQDEMLTDVVREVIRDARTRVAQQTAMVTTANRTVEDIAEIAPWEGEEIPGRGTPETPIGEPVEPEGPGVMPVPTAPEIPPIGIIGPAPKPGLPQPPEASIPDTGILPVPVPVRPPPLLPPGLVGPGRPLPPVGIPPFPGLLPPRPPGVAPPGPQPAPPPGVPPFPVPGPGLLPLLPGLPPAIPPGAGRPLPPAGPVAPGPTPPPILIITPGEPELPPTAPGAPPLFPPGIFPPGEVAPPSEPGGPPAVPAPPETHPPGVMPPIEVCAFDPGDPQLCVTINSYLGPFGQVGQRIEELLDAVAGSIVSAHDSLISVLDGLPGPFKFGSAIASMVPIRTLIDTLQAFRQMPRAAKHTKTLTLIGLWGARALLRLLEEATVGWELGPQLLFSLRFEMPQLRMIVDYLINFVCPAESASTAEVQNLWLDNRIGVDQAECLAAMQGRSPKLFHLLSLTGRTAPDDIVLVRDWMRFGGTREEIHALLRGKGWLLPDERDKLIRSQQFIPPPSDLIPFAVKDVYNPGKIGRAEMLKELEEQQGLRELMGVQGIGKFDIRTPEGKALSYDTVADYWLAHYHNVSPTQVFEMLHRLRPERVDRFSFRGANGRIVRPAPVVIGDVRALLKEDDFNPAWRDRLAAISYRVLTRVDVRRVYGTGGFGEPQGTKGFATRPDGTREPVGPAEKELTAQNEDAGYNHDDAVRLAWFTAKERDRTSTAAEKKQRAALVCSVYTEGGYTFAQAETVLRGVLDTPEQATQFLSHCDAKLRLRDLKQGIATVRKLYLRTEWSALQARDAILALGVTPERTAQLLRLWATELLARRKEVQASTMCDWYGKGLITLDEMRVRLLRMSYTPDDADRIIRHCQIGTLARDRAERDKVIKARLKDQERVARLAEKRARTEEQVRQTALAKFLAARSEKHLLEWLLAGEITEEATRNSLLLKGWVKEDIDRWFKVNVPAAKKKREKEQQKEQPPEE